MQIVFLSEFQAWLNKSSVTSLHASPRVLPPLLLCSSGDADAAHTATSKSTAAPTIEPLTPCAALPAAQRADKAVRKGTLLALTGKSAQALADAQPFLSGGFKARRMAELMWQQRNNVSSAKQDADGVRYEPMVVCSADTSIATHSDLEAAFSEQHVASKSSAACAEPYTAMALVTAPPVAELLAAGCSETAERVTGTTMTLTQLMADETALSGAADPLKCARRWSLRSKVRSTQTRQMLFCTPRRTIWMSTSVLASNV